MGYQFQRHSHINPFVIDQTWTVNFDSRDNQLATEFVLQYSDELMKRGGTAGFLTEQVPDELSSDNSEDAVLLSTPNELE